MSSRALPRLDAFKITGDTLDHFIDLRIAEDEAPLIASVPEWLAEAGHQSVAQTFGLSHGARAVGLISLVDPRLLPTDEQDDFQTGCLYVWRVMVDRTARGAGFGAAAMAFAEGYARLVGLRGLSLTTADKKPVNALGFYETLGFAPTGRRLQDEIELIRHFAR